ncbi:type III-D CRISPR-associated protein Csx19 [Streptomyces ardesiacus]|uniref:type III-D CRISPR-associated protein Csx19 n=1 Tax=Streptomyces ardesiacus TaxID=285564 RepID=UPI0036AC7323
MTTLHARAAQSVTLAEALTATAFPTAVALLSAPHAHTVAHVTEGRCRTRQADPYDLSTVFEARVFDGERELRWLCDTGDRGRAVLLTEDETLLPATFPEPVTPLSATAALTAHYLLWGRPAGGDEEWTVLHTPRIGTLTVPHPRPGPELRLRLVAREYISTDPRHGNSHVSEERLLRIETVPAAPQEDTHV